MNFADFLRTPFFTEHLQWLLLKKLLPVAQRCSVNKLFFKNSQYLQELNAVKALFTFAEYFRANGFCNYVMWKKMQT